MMSAGDPSAPRKGDYVVPLPRETDALGRSLNRIYPPDERADPFADLIRRLDTLH